MNKVYILIRHLLYGITGIVLIILGYTLCDCQIMGSSFFKGKNQAGMPREIDGMKLMAVSGQYRFYASGDRAEFALYDNIHPKITQTRNKKNQNDATRNYYLSESDEHPCCRIFYRVKDNLINSVEYQLKAESETETAYQYQDTDGNGQWDYVVEMSRGKSPVKKKVSLREKEKE